MESIDALAKAINEFEGGLVLVSHDMRLIGQVAKEIWICDNRTITKYKGDIQNFKMDMRAQMGIGANEAAPKLRGDASTKQKDKPADKAPAAPKKESKLEVVAPTKKPTKKDSNIEDDNKTVSTVTSGSTTMTTYSSVPTSVSATKPTSPTAASAAPVRGKYIPPHLRKKMLVCSC